MFSKRLFGAIPIFVPVSAEAGQGTFATDGGKTMKLHIPIWLGLIAALTLTSPAAAQEHVPGRVLIKFTSGLPHGRSQEILDAVGATVEKDLPQIGVKVLSLPADADETAVANALSHRPGVQFAELDRFVAQESTTPNDPWFLNQWHLYTIQAPAAWDFTRGSSSVTIAILDGGVDASHPDLAGLIVPGWNAYNNNNNTADVNGHGTAVAGCAAAMSNNGFGVASVAWNCRLMPIRISDSSGTATYSSMAAGLNWAADHGAKVANLSYIANNSSTVTNAAQYFVNRGGFVTCSSGNYGSFVSTPDNPYILTVGASNTDDTICSTSNYGNCVDVAAPGAMIYTTKVGGGYGPSSGTSMASPVAAGVAALIMSVNPSLTPASVRQIIQDSADDKGAPGRDSYFGYGRVNAYRAVMMALSASGSGGDTTAPSVSFSQPSNGVTLQDSFNLVAQASDNVGVAGMTMSIDGVQVASSASGSCSYSWNTNNAANGSHTLGVTARDAANNSSTSTIVVYVENVVDMTPPSVAITNPTGGTVNSVVSVAVSATDNVGVAKVELYVDGRLTSTSTSAPFSNNWNAKRASRGNHSLQTRAYDGSGNGAWSQAVTVTR
jgi:thermitase